MLYNILASYSLVLHVKYFIFVQNIFWILQFEN
jgi:hypothetical protein